MSEEEKLTFKEACELPIGNEVAKKGGYSYLSWSYAVRHLRENYPDAVWIIHENAIGNPVFEIGETYMVKVSVIIDGLEFTQWHPVLDFKNKAKVKVDTMDINTSIQRCLTKAIALATGIGLGIYNGEDLPTDEPKKEEKVYVESNLPSWTERFDKLETAAERKQCYKDNEEAIFDELTKQEVANLQSYLVQLKADEDKKSKLNIDI